uniref:AIG1-type G domain-containing protein n=1 Tax=Neogobius melanostomus TaxID=47308 RepID=A0A8C6WLD2_9GOBI
MADIPNLRIVTLDGSGKSGLANTLFEEETFSEGHSANSETQSCQSKNKIIDGINVQLVDTPGFFDTDKQKGTKLKDELLKCIIKCAPGPHAFLLMLKVERYTSQEEAVVDQMIEYFSEEALKITTVMFTDGDQLPEGTKIEEWVQENESLQKLVQKCGGRCCVIDNKYWNNSQDTYRNNQHQIKQLLEIIKKTMEENKGHCHTNEILLNVAEMKEREEDRLVRYLVKQFSPDISEESFNQEVNISVFTKLKENWVGVTVGALFGAFVGGLGSAFCAGSRDAGLSGAGAAAGVGAVRGRLFKGVIEGLVSACCGPVVKGMKSDATKLHAHMKSLSNSGLNEWAKLLTSD